MIRTKNEMRQQWETGDSINQVVAYDMIDTMFSAVDALSSVDISYTTVQSSSANWNSTYNTVCSISSQWMPLNQFPLTLTDIPSASTVDGYAGNWAHDSSTFYFCVTTNSWIKFNILSSW